MNDAGGSEVLRLEGMLSYETIPGILAGTAEFAARTDLLEPLHRVRLERVEVSGGPEMVVFRLRRCGV